MFCSGQCSFLAASYQHRPVGTFVYVSDSTAKCLEVWQEFVETVYCNIKLDKKRTYGPKLYNNLFRSRVCPLQIELIRKKIQYAPS